MTPLFLLATAAPDAAEAHKWLGASYPDWLMALGGIATFGTLLYLLISGRGQQRSINAIITSLGELTKHSAELTKQSQEMSVRNQLQTQLNAIMSEQVAIMRQMHQAGEVTNEEQRRMLQLEEERRRIELKPVFGYTSALGNQNSSTLSISVINYGKGSATIRSIDVINGSNNIQVAYPQIPITVSPNGSFFINGRWQNVPESQLVFELNIKYLDLMNNEYETNMMYSPRGIDFSEPKLVK